MRRAPHREALIALVCWGLLTAQVAPPGVATAGDPPLVTKRLAPQRAPGECRDFEGFVLRPGRTLVVASARCATRALAVLRPSPVDQSAAEATMVATSSDAIAIEALPAGAELTAGARCRIGRRAMQWVVLGRWSAPRAATMRNGALIGGWQVDPVARRFVRVPRATLRRARCMRGD